MADILSFNEYKKLNLKKKTSKVTSLAAKKLSKAELIRIFTDTTIALHTEWCVQIKQENFNKVIASKLGLPVKEYLTDLNVVAETEHFLKMPCIPFFPGATKSNPNGWMSGFHYDDLAFTTPLLENECQARIFSVLLQMSFLAVINK